MRGEGHVSDLCLLYMTACLILVHTKFIFHNFVKPYTACLLCIWCSLHASSSHRGNLFLQHKALYFESFHSLGLHVS